MALFRRILSIRSTRHLAHRLPAKYFSYQPSTSRIFTPPFRCAKSSQQKPNSKHSCPLTHCRNTEMIKWPKRLRFTSRFQKPLASLGQSAVCSTLVLVAQCTFSHNLLMLNISFGCCRHSVSNTVVQLTEGRSARDKPKQLPARKKCSAHTVQRLSRI